MYKKEFRPNETSYSKLYKIWAEFLMERIIKIFKWEGEDLPSQHHIEEPLILQGMTCITPYKKELVAFYCSIYGNTIYYDEFSHVTINSPILSKSMKIGKNNVVVYNNSLKNGTWKLVHLYSALLAHTMVTYILSVINMRDAKTAVVNTVQQLHAYEEYVNSIANGRMKPIVDKTFQDVVFSDLQMSGFHAGELYELCGTILNDFYAHFGVRTVYRKKGNLIETEVTGDEQKLLINVSDMLEERKGACGRIKEVFNRDWEVSFAPESDIIPPLDVVGERIGEVVNEAI